MAKEAIPVPYSCCYTVQRNVVIFQIWRLQYDCLKFKLLHFFSLAAKKINEDKGNYSLLYFNQNAIRKNS